MPETTLNRPPVPTPHSHNLTELPTAAPLRAALSSLDLPTPSELNPTAPQTLDDPALQHILDSPAARHILHGLALTTGSALGCTPPSDATCRAAFAKPNSAGLSAGARAWTKHAHRSGTACPTAPVSTAAREAANTPNSSNTDAAHKHESTSDAGWWGRPFGPVSTLNARAHALLERVLARASWRNLHWLPHDVLVYEVRVPEGYGMRWAQDRGVRGGVGDGRSNVDGNGQAGDACEVGVVASTRPEVARIGFSMPRARTDDALLENAGRPDTAGHAIPPASQEDGSAKEDDAPRQEQGAPGKDVVVSAEENDASRQEQGASVKEEDASVKEEDAAIKEDYASATMNTVSAAWHPSNDEADENDSVPDENLDAREWVFRGFLEPQMDGGHPVGWRH